MRISKLLFALPLISVSYAAMAEINIDDAKNVSYGSLAINADGSVLIGGKEVAKCQGDKVTKLKMATVTCDENYITVKDKKGNSLSRFSGYAMASSGKGEPERKQFDDNLAAIGSATTGAASFSKTETKVLTSESTAKTETLASPTTVSDGKPVKPPVNEKTYTPKLGVEAQKSPSIINKQRPAENAKDKKEEKFVEQQKAKTDDTTGVTTPNTVTVKTVESDPKVVETTKTTTIVIPADGSAPVTDTELKAKVIQDPEGSPSLGQ